MAKALSKAAREVAAETLLRLTERCMEPEAELLALYEQVEQTARTEPNGLALEALDEAIEMLARARGAMMHARRRLR
jgi:hypothetical protein